MTMQEIERALRELRLSGIAATLSTRVMQAHSTQEPFLDTFAAMLQDELDRRRSRLPAGTNQRLASGSKRAPKALTASRPLNGVLRCLSSSAMEG